MSITERGIAIAKQHEQIKNIIWLVSDNTFRVISDTKYYAIHCNKESGYSCTCPHFTFKHSECKHIIAVKYCIENNIWIPTLV